MRHSLPHRRRCCPRAFIILMLVTIAPALSSAAVLDYSGTWFNKTFNAAGAAVARLDTDAQPTVTFTLDLTGDVFGGPFGFPPVTPLTLHGTLNPDQSVAFAPVFGHATYGTVVASFSSGGAVSIFCDPMPVSPPSIYARTHINRRAFRRIDRPAVSDADVDRVLFREHRQHRVEHCPGTVRGGVDRVDLDGDACSVAAHAFSLAEPARRVTHKLTDKRVVQPRKRERPLKTL